jgi:hypothetical protein
MTVQAKVRCIGNAPPQHITDGSMQTARFTPVADLEGSNAEWSKWTPYGYIELAITNPDAFGQFVPGVEYLLTFEAVSAP